MFYLLKPIRSIKQCLHYILHQHNYSHLRFEHKMYLKMANSENCNTHTCLKDKICFIFVSCVWLKDSYKSL